MTVSPPSRRKRASSTPKDYDFRQPVALTRDHARVLEMAMENFARQWGTLMSSRLAALATVTLDEITLSPYADYIDSLPTSTTAVTLQVEPQRSTALLQVPTNLTMTLVDCLLGGPAVDLDMPFRELTTIEWKLVGELLDYACGDLSYALASVVTTKFSVQDVKYNPGFIQLTQPNEQVIVARFDVRVGPVSGPVTLMLMADPLMIALRSRDEQAGRTVEEQREHDEAVALLTDGMVNVPLDVATSFRGRTVRATEITALAVGDVVPLNHPKDRPLDVVVGGVTLAQAAIGANGTRAACLIVSTEEEL